MKKEKLKKEKKERKGRDREENKTTTKDKITTLVKIPNSLKSNRKVPPPQIPTPI